MGKNFSVLASFVALVTLAALALCLSPTAAWAAHIIMATTGGYGTISPTGSVSVSNGGNQTFTFTPYAGYDISQVSVDGVPVGLTSNSYQFTNVTQNHAIHVLFAPLLTGTVGFTVNPATGEVTASATGGNTGTSGALTYTWTGGATGTDTTATPTLGDSTTCTVKASGALGSINASVIVYKVEIVLSGDTGTDAATVANGYGKVGDNITISYTLGNYGTQSNTLTYSGVAIPPAQVNTPNTPGTSTSTYTIATADAAANGIITITATFAHTNTMPAITTAATLPNGTVGTAYSQTLAATGDTPMTWEALLLADLPPGLTLSQSGIISGTPTATGTFNFEIRATNSVGSDSMVFTLTVNDVHRKRGDDGGCGNIMGTGVGTFGALVLVAALMGRRRR